jgi:hypothetical protein
VIAATAIVGPRLPGLALWAIVLSVLVALAVIEGVEARRGVVAPVLAEDRGTPLATEQ